MSDHPPFAVTVDIAVFTIRDDALCVLLVERGAAPYEGDWALPGGFVEPDEDAETAAWRDVVVLTPAQPLPRRYGKSALPEGAGSADGSPRPPGPDGGTPSGNDSGSAVAP